ncbi:M28 family peptidase [Flavihumibacter fluvii]|uniref:M28 family peptidase n=1 Tax=Flavihumibacter fluvii TaxID=2838157 RepID=UPI001BDE82B7|nr:M28 family peptidase [Flavihumibacter fluvii]ULQ51846.1 M28 family peptidase [Flavihumibacter fluvii]
MRKLCLLLGLFPATLGIAQKKTSPTKIAATITETDLRTHLYIVAGADMEGRETASEGQRKAAAYIENHFKSLGLLPGNKASYQMSFPVFRDSLVDSKLIVNDKAFSLNKDYQPILQLSRSGSQYFSEIVLVGHGIVDSAFDDYANIDVAGKAVLILDGAPANYTTNQKGWRAPNTFYGKYQNAMKKGAAAILMVGTGYPKKELAPLGNMYTDLYTPKVGANLYTISPDVAAGIVGADWPALLQSSKTGRVAAKIVPTELALELNKTVLKLQSSNVLGYIEGTDKKDEWLIITAHYDHLGKKGDVIYYGADDDGSGTVSVLEIAEAFAKAKAAGMGPRRNILFMTVSGEEKGLWGSKYYSDHPTIPIEKATADLNIDMIGRVDTERKSADTLNYVYVVGDDKLSTDLKPISETVNKKYMKMNLDYKFNDPNDPQQIYFRSDHYNFAAKGVPVIFYYDGMLLADYHQPTDTPEKINYTLLKRRAQLVFYTAWEMANRNDQIKRDLAIPTMTR